MYKKYVLVGCKSQYQGVFSRDSFGLIYKLPLQIHIATTFYGNGGVYTIVHSGIHWG
jgi:hypothetical protein